MRLGFVFLGQKMGPLSEGTIGPFLIALCHFRVPSMPRERFGKKISVWVAVRVHQEMYGTYIATAAI